MIGLRARRRIRIEVRVDVRVMVMVSGVMDRDFVCIYSPIF